MAVSIEINGAPAGSKEITGALPQNIPLDEVGGTAATWAWTLLDRPPGSIAALSSLIIQNPILNNVDTEGSYLLRVIVDGGAETDIEVAYFKHTFLDERIPAAGETSEVHATRGWADARDTRLMNTVITELGRGRGTQTVRLVGKGGGYSKGELVDIRQSGADPDNSFLMDNGLRVPYAATAATQINGTWGFVLEGLDGAVAAIANGADELARVVLFGQMQDVATFGGGVFTDNDLLYMHPTVAGAVTEDGSLFEGAVFNPIEYRSVARVLDATNGVVEVMVDKEIFDPTRTNPKVLGPMIFTGEIVMGVPVALAAAPAAIEIANRYVLCAVAAPLAYGSSVVISDPGAGPAGTALSAVLATSAVIPGTRFGAVAFNGALPGSQGADFYQTVLVDGYIDSVPLALLPGGVAVDDVLCIGDGVAAPAGEYVQYPTGVIAGHQTGLRTIPIATVHALAATATLRIQESYEQIPSWGSITESTVPVTIGPRYAGDELTITPAANMSVRPTAGPPRDLGFRKYTRSLAYFGINQASIFHTGIVTTALAPTDPGYGNEWDPTVGPPNATMQYCPFIGLTDASVLISWDLGLMNRRYSPDAGDQLFPGDELRLWLEAGYVSAIRFDLIFWSPSVPNRTFSLLHTSAGGDVFGAYGLWARTWTATGVPPANGWKIESGFLGDATNEWGGAHPQQTVHPYDSFAGDAIVLQQGFTRQGILEYDPRSPSFPTAPNGWDLFDAITDDPSFYYTFGLQLMSDDTGAGVAGIWDLGVVGLEVSAILSD